MRDKLPIYSDQEIVTLLLNKDEQGIEILYRQYGGFLYGFITQIVNRNDFAQLVLQNTFLKIWNNIESFDFKKGIFITWMISIARNTAIDMLRSKDYKQTLRLLSFENIPSGEEPMVEGIRIEHIDVKEMLRKLKPDCSEILEYVYFKGYTYKEASEELGIPLGTAKSRIRKGFKDLRNILKESD